MTYTVKALSTGDIVDAQAQAAAIGTAATPAVGSNTFVFFAGFDGTWNNSPPVLGNTQDTAVAQLKVQVDANKTPNGPMQAGYYAGVGASDSLLGAYVAGAFPLAESLKAAQDAYKDFAEQAFNWHAAHPSDTLTSMITSFSRGGAAAAIFSQMLYEKGLIFTDPQTKKETLLIPPGTAGAISAALIIDPVLTGESGNMYFPPGVTNLTIVRAENEYRDYFTAADYTGDGATVLSVMGNHGDAGDAYDNGLGAIYLQSYTDFFRNAGLDIGDVADDRDYQTIPTAAIHSESVLNSAFNDTYNSTDDLTVARHTNSYGTAATVVGTASKFIAYNGDIVLGGTGGTYTGSEFEAKTIAVLTDNHVSVTGTSNMFNVAGGAVLTYTNTSSAPAVDAMTLADGASVILNGANELIVANNASVEIGAGYLGNSISGKHNHITLNAGARIAGSNTELATDSITFKLGGGGSLTLAAGTFLPSASYTNTGTLNITLKSANTPFGTLTFDTATNVASLKLLPTTTWPGQLVIALPNISGDITLSALSASATPRDALLSYLSDLGNPLSASDLNDLNQSFLNIAGTAHTLTGTVHANYNNTAAEVEYIADAPGASATGSSTATITVNGNPVTVPATNILASNTNISRDEITGIPTLQVNGGTTLTGDQYTGATGFTSIKGSGTLYLTDGGAYTLNQGNLQGSFNLAAQSWLGTTLTGSSANNETLTASVFGNDTLNAGMGADVTLKAGLGVDILNGSSNGTTQFSATNGLAPGSQVNAHGTGNSLYATGDISGASIDGVQALSGGGIMLTASQWAGFSSITALSVTGATGGDYSVAGKSVMVGALTLASDDDASFTGNGTGNFHVIVTGDGNATLTGKDAAGVTTGSFFQIVGDGDAILTAGQGNGNLLGATGNGTITMAAGNGSGNALSATGFGVKTLIAGNGASNVLSSLNGNAVMFAGNGNSNVLSSGGADVMVAGTGSGNTLSATGAGSRLTANGTNASFSVTGGDSVISNGANAAVTLTGSGNVISLLSTGNTVTDNGGGNNRFILAGSTTVTGGTGFETYVLAEHFGQTVINNNGGSAANGQLVFASGVDTEKLWFAQTGNHLLITRMGTSENVTINGWYASDGAQLSSILLPGGGTLANAEVAALVSSMADYAAANPGFDPTAVASVPTDTTLQAALSAAWATPTGVTNVTDTAANVTAGLDGFEALAASGQLGSITITDPATPLALTATQLAQDVQTLGSITSAYTLAVSEVFAANAATIAARADVTSVDVSDTGGNVAASLDALQALAAGGTLASVALVDEGATLAVTATQLANDTDALSAIAGDYNLAVSAVLAADAATVATNTHVTSITVSDTAANVLTNLDALQTLAAGGTLASVALTDGGTPTLSITGAQFTNDAAALAAIAGSYSLAVSGALAADAGALAANTHVTSATVSDTGANVATNLNSLQTLGTKLTSIALTDGSTPTLALTATQLSADATALSKISSNYNLAISAVTAANAASTAAQAHVTSIAVSDTAANVVTNIASLETLALSGKLAAIGLTDSGTPTLSLTQAQFAADAEALGAITSAYNLAVSAVTAANAAATSSAAHVTAITVSDTAANLGSAGLDTLQTIAAAGKLTSVTVTNNSVAVPITLAQMTSDAAAIGLFTGTYSFTVSGVSVAGQASLLAQPHIASVGISDTAANVNAALDTLQGLGTKIVAIGLTDSGTPTLAITSTQFTSDATAIAKISGSYSLSVSGVLAASAATVFANSHVTGMAIVDTGANVATSLNTLQADNTKITSITLTDGSTPTLAVTATQLANDGGALALIASPYNLAVSGVTAANVATVASNTHVTSLTVSDSAANVLANLDALQTVAAGGQLASVALTDGGTPTLALTATQFTNDSAALAAITGAYDLTVSGMPAGSTATVAANTHVTSLTVSDTGANTATNIDALQALGALLTSIVLTDSGTPTLALTATQLSADATALSKIGSNYNLAISSVLAANATSTAATAHVTSLAVSDTAAHVVTSLAALQTLAVSGKLSSISFTDSGTPALGLTQAQFTADAAAIALITSPYSVTVTGVLAADAATIAAQTGVTSVSISDTAANVISNLDALQTLAAAGKVATIALTNGGTPTLSITSTQLSADATALGKISSAYNLTVSGVSAASAATVSAQAHVTSMTISDTAANVVTNIASLQSVVAEITSIALTDGGTPTLSITGAQFTADATTIAKIAGSYSLSVSSVLAASAATVGGNTHTTAMTIVDTGANVATNLNALQTQNAKVTSITLTDGSTPTLAITATQFSADAAALGKIGSSYNLAVSAVTVANATSTSNATHVTSIAVTDTAANLGSANLDTLQTIAAAGKLTSVTVSNSATAVAITLAQMTSDATAIGLFTGTYNFSISGVSVSGQASLLAQPHIASVSISDTAANVNAALDTLQGLGTKIVAIALTDGGTPTLSITGTQFTADTTTIAKIAGSYSLSVSSVLAASAATVGGNTHTTAMTIVDTGANVATNLNALQAQNAKVTSITLTDGSTPTLAINSAQFTADSAALAKIASAYNLAVSAVTAANAVSTSNAAHVATISVTDTAANLSGANFDTLQGLAASGKLTAVAVSNGMTPAIITLAQWNGSTTLVGLFTGTYYFSISGVSVAGQAALLATAHVASVSISDTAANVNAALDTLQPLGAKIVAIALTDGGTPTLSITGTQFTADATTIAKIAGAYSLSVSSVLAASAATVGGNTHTTAMTIVDTGANVATNLNALQAQNAKVTSITLTDGSTPTLAITATQFTADAAALGKIGSSYNLAVSAVTAANATSTAAAAHVVSIAVTDTAANLSANINALQTIAAAGELTSVTVSNNTVAVAITLAQMTSDATAIGLFTGTYSFSVSGVSVANQASLLAQPHIASVSISDTAANVNAALDTLQGLGTKIVAIALTDGGTPVLSITGAQFTADATTIAKISGSYSLSVSNVLAASAATVGGNTHTTAMTIVDTGANVATNLNALQTQNAKVTSITLTDGSTPTLAITATQFSADTAALGKIASSYNLAVSAVTAANATSTAAAAHVTSIAVSDTAANLSTNINALQTIAAAGELTSVTVTNNTVPVAITLAQLTSDATAIGLFTGTYNFTVSGVSVAGQASLLAQPHIASVSISDTAANVNAALDTLQGLGTKIVAIAMTDGGTPTLSITGAQFTADATTIAKISGSYSLSVSSVLAASAATVGGNIHTTAMTIVDTGANVATNLNALQTQNAKVTSITLTDGSTPTLAITATQLTSDAAALGKIGSSYNLAVSAVTSANVTSVGSNTHVTSILVSDTVANVTTNLAALQTSATAGKLTSIALTDATPVLTLTGTQLNNNAGAIAKITSSYKETITADANTTETLAGTGSLNTLSFNSETQGVNANLAAGSATTVNGGNTYTYTESNFQNVIGSTSADTLTAGTANGYLTGNGGTDTYVLSATGIGAVKDTAAHLNGNTIQNFSTLDGIDLTTVLFSAHPTLGFSEDASNTFGTLTVSDGTHAASLLLLGQYAASSFQTVSDGGTGTLVAMAGTGNLTAILAAAHG